MGDLHNTNEVVEITRYKTHESLFDVWCLRGLYVFTMRKVGREMARDYSLFLKKRKNEDYYDFRTENELNFFKWGLRPLPD